MTRTGYEQQMTVLTEHITMLNEKLGKIEDYVDNIKSQRVYCGKCKKWNTIGKNERELN